jgi:hypothetical protein
VNYLVGVDFGQLGDYSPITVIQCTEEIRRRPGPAGIEALEADIVPYYDLRWADRPELGTSYPEVRRRVKEVAEREEIRTSYALVVDLTGVGLAVAQEMVRDGLAPIGISITSGRKVNEEDEDDGIIRVPKKELITTMLLLIQSGRFKASPKVPFAAMLAAEMENFRMKINRRGHETFEAWREGDKDDLVLATAIPLWYAEHVGGIRPLNLHPGGPSPDERAQRDYDPLARRSQ